MSRLTSDAAPDAAPRRRKRRGRGWLYTLLVFAPLIILLADPLLLLLRHGADLVGLALSGPPAALPVPVEGVTPPQLADTWGAPRSGGRSHEGIDIFAPRGTPVLAATRGVVTRRGENRLGGRVVTVLGPGRQFHYYAHMEDWSAVEEGDWVDAGTVLGYVGTSGNAAGTPPHLHYGVYTASGAINPYPLLTAVPGALP